MTKGPAPDASYENRSFGAPGAERTVVLLRSGISTLSDPRPDVTARRDVRIVAVGLTVDVIDDPALNERATLLARARLILDHASARSEAAPARDPASATTE